MKSISVLLLAVATLLTTQANAWCVKNATLAEAKATLTVEHLNTAKLKENKATISSLSPGETICDPVLAAGANPTGNNQVMLRVQMIVESGVPGCMDKKTKACIKVCTNGGAKSAVLAITGKNVAQVSRDKNGEFFVTVDASSGSAQGQNRFICK